MQLPTKVSEKKSFHVMSVRAKKGTLARDHPYPKTPYPIKPRLYMPLHLRNASEQAFDEYCQAHPWWPDWLKDLPHRDRLWAFEQLEERGASIDTVLHGVHFPSLRQCDGRGKQYRIWHAEAVADYEARRAAHEEAAATLVQLSERK